MTPIDDLLKAFATPARRKALGAIVRSAAQRPAMTGLAGSSAAMAIASLPLKGRLAMVVGSDPDDAGYLYHDLSRIVGEDALAMFPSGYKRDIRFGQVDAPAVILRTEALTRIADDPSLRFVITYPEALAEQVAPRDEIAKGTITL